MKIRTAFITNSSSSSFIIVVKDKELSEIDRRILELVLNYDLGQTREQEDLNSEIMKFDSSDLKFAGSYSQAVESGCYKMINLDYLRKEVKTGALVFGKDIGYQEDFLLTILAKCLGNKVQIYKGEY